MVDISEVPLPLDVRPTSDRLRETLFNILAPRINGTRVFGSLRRLRSCRARSTIERSSSMQRFVDRSRKMCGRLIGSKSGFVSRSGRTNRCLQLRGLRFPSSSGHQKNSSLGHHLFRPTLQRQLSSCARVSISSHAVELLNAAWATCGRTLL